ncbi:MAG TPA: hypothetical protein VIR29_14490 [Anseongella sp.]
MKKLFFIVGLLLLLFSAAPSVQAQCAMCGSTVNSSSAEGGNQAAGLNSGILYMLAVPYLAVMGIGYLWYKKYRKKNIVMNVEDKEISLN